MSLRTVVLDIPPQDVITRDNVTIKVNAVVFFRVIDALKAIIDVENLPLCSEPARPDDLEECARSGRA